MARTLAEAIAAIEGPRFDEVVGYAVRRPKPRPAPSAVTAALSGLPPDYLFRLAKKLARQHRCQRTDADEALQEALAELWMTRPERFREDPRSWTPLLLAVARIRLRRILAERGRMVPFDLGASGKADPHSGEIKAFVDLSPEGDERARYEAPPAPGEAWSSSQIIGAFQRFRDYYGRPPRTADCKAINGLPSLGVIYRHFASFADAVLAAGMVPENPGRQRREWQPLEAALACRSFYRRHGHWPGSTDIKRWPGVLPCAGAMVRFFGSTNPAEVQRKAEAIIAGSLR